MRLIVYLFNYNKCVYELLRTRLSLIYDFQGPSRCLAEKARQRDGAIRFTPYLLFLFC